MPEPGEVTPELTEVTPAAAASSADGVADSQGMGFEKWEASDLDLDVLGKHAGPELLQLGVRIKQRDMHSMYYDEDLVQAHSMIVGACVYPPTSHQEYLNRLLQKYTKANRPMSSMDQRIYYDAMCFEAIVSQLPNATVAFITRRGDLARIGTVPFIAASLGHVPGCTPMSCNMPLESDLTPLHGGHDLVIRIQEGAKLTPQVFIGEDGALNIIEMCAAAKALNWKVLFVGVWDGGLPLACALGVMRHRTSPSAMPPEGPELEEKELRMFHGYTGNYVDYHSYCKDYRVTEVMREYMQQGVNPARWPGISPQAAEAAIQPHANINAATMWYFAKRVARTSGVFNIGSGPHQP